jgi:hypothetical protein
MFIWQHVGIGVSGCLDDAVAEPAKDHRATLIRPLHDDGVRLLELMKPDMRYPGVLTQDKVMVFRGAATSLPAESRYRWAEDGGRRPSTGSGATWNACPRRRLASRRLTSFATLNEVGLAGVPLANSTLVQI